MTSPGIVINNPPPPEHKPLIYVSPPLPSGPVIFSSGPSLPSINVTTPADLKLGQPLIFQIGARRNPGAAGLFRSAGSMPVIFQRVAAILATSAGLRKD